MSLHISSEAEFRKWRRKSRELRAQIENPEQAPVVVELLGEVERLQRKIQKHERRIKTLEAQIGKVYAAGYNRE